MRTIGLLGGTSWPSTMEYYRILNQMTSERLGGYHSARIILKSIDYHEIKSRYHQGWDLIPELVKKEVSELIGLRPDCIILCNNTLHEALDLVRPELKTELPIFHAVDLVAERATRLRYKRVLLLGTKHTMEHSYYSNRLKAQGLEVSIPIESDRIEIQEIQNQLSRGELKAEFDLAFRKMISKFSDLDAVITACTELPIVVTAQVSPLPILDPMRIQCEEAVRFALSKMDNF